MERVMTKKLLSGGRLFLFLLLWLWLPTQNVQSATWIGSYNTNYWNFICYDKVNDALLATTDTNIYHSIDKGNNWNQVSNPSFEHIQLMISTAQGIIACSSSGKLYKSTDIGTSWTRIGEGVFSSVKTYSANDSGIIFVGTYSSGLMVSSNGGLSWTMITNSNFDEPGYIEDVLVDKDGVLYVAHYWGRVYSSLDGGSTWVKSSKAFDSSPGCLASAPDGTLYVGTYWEGVFKSENKGSTWTSMSNGLPENRGVAFITAYSNNSLYSLVNDQRGTVGLYRYNNSDDTWLSANGGFSVNQRRSSSISATDGSRVWLAQGYYGIGASNNGGQSWTGFKSSVSPQNVISMAGTPDGILYVACNGTPNSVCPNSTAMGVLSTTDRGNTWLDLNNGLNEFDMAVQGVAVSDNNSLILLPYSPGKILTKTSHSSQWERQNLDAYSTFASIYKADDGTLLIGNHRTGVRTSIDGYNWTLLNNTWPDGAGSGIVSKDSNGIIYADCRDQTGSKGLYRYTTSDGWEYVAFSGKSLTAFLSIKNNKMLASTYNEIFISNDQGISWETFSNGLPSETSAYAFLEGSDGTLYAAVRGRVYGVYRYNTTQEIWKSTGFPLNSSVTRVYSLTFMKGYLFAGTDNGVFYLFENMCVYYRDFDSDGYGDPESPYEAASQPAGYVTDNADCNDYDSSIHPGATEIRGDGIDQDCSCNDLESLENPSRFSVLTDSSTTTVTDEFVTHIYGCTGANNIIIEKGAGAKLINMPGSNTITIHANTGAFSVHRSGAMVTFEGTDGTMLTMSVTNTAQTIVFDDKSFTLKIDAGSMMLDDQVIGAARTSL